MTVQSIFASFTVEKTKKINLKPCLYALILFIREKMVKSTKIPF